MSSKAGRAVGPAVPHGLRQRRSAGQGCRDHRQTRIPAWSHGQRLADAAGLRPWGRSAGPDQDAGGPAALAPLLLTMIEGR